MKNKKKPVHLPLPHALAWIVGSALLISGSSHLILKRYFTHRQSISRDPRFAIHSIIQTGPQKEALKTEYLAELLGISRDRPYSCLSFDLERAKQRLLQSPLISKAEVKLIKPSARPQKSLEIFAHQSPGVEIIDKGGSINCNTTPLVDDSTAGAFMQQKSQRISWSGTAALYVDYTVRQPIAWIEDYVNIAIDKEGYLFPFTPFFSPKHLPALYLGLPPFGIPEADPERPSAQWNTPMRGKYIDLAFKILAIVMDPKAAHAFSVKRIDVSNAFAESYGTREIVVMTEDRLIKQKGVEVRIPRILRLSTKNYAQELGNYLKLREQLLAEEKQSPELQFKEKIIDFRIQKLAFIELK